MNTTIHSTSGLALKGVMVRPAGRHEAFQQGTLSDDTLVLVYASERRVPVSPRKCERVRSQRIVRCERRWNDQGDDFWWYGVQQVVLSHTV